jgi:cell division septation protein DedD
MATRDGELFAERIEVNLDGRQIFCLFCGGAVIASLVFVLGVTVGRRVEARDHTDSSVAGGATSDPLAALDHIAAQEDEDEEGDLAFASTLRSEDEGDPLGPVDVSLERAPAARRAPPPPRPAAQPAVPELAQERIDQARAERAEAEKVAADKAAADKAAADKAAADKAAADKAAADKAAADKAAADKAARFTLHLLSFEKRSEADALVTKLKNAGYQPYIVEGREEGRGTLYRVRVGQYADFEAAVAGKTEFEGKQQIIAYVTRTR